MAITTMDGIVAGLSNGKPHFFHKAITPTLVTGKHQSLWGLGGIPGAGGWDNTLNGVVLSSTSALVNGQLPFYDTAVSQTYLARLVGNCTIAGNLLLCDRLWHNGNYSSTSTSAQNTTSPTWPARDDDGATAGKGVLLGVEVESAMGAATVAITVSYTNSGSTSGHSGTNLFTTTSSAAAGSFFPIGLQAGDVGVKSVQSLTLGTSWLSGTMHLVAYRVIAEIPLSTVNVGYETDAIRSGMPPMYDGSVPFLLFLPATTTASYISGTFQTMAG